MNKSFIAILAIVFLNIGIVFSQATEYKIYYSSGKVWYKMNGKTEKVQRDAAIKEGYTLCVDDASYVVLINQAEVPMAISSPGEYSLRKIKSLYTKMKQSNLTAEFFMYIASNMMPESDKHHQSGGVYKAMETYENPFSPEFAFNQLPGDSVLIIDTVIDFSWGKIYESPVVLKILADTADTVICEVPAGSSGGKININSCGLQAGKTYRWMVCFGEYQIDLSITQKSFKLAEANDIKRIKTELAEIDKTAKSEELRKMAKLRVYFDNHIYPTPGYSGL